jgi:hypothetical protein
MQCDWEGKCECRKKIDTRVEWERHVQAIDLEMNCEKN